ncbi:MAG: peptide chain release factor 2 [Alphaproteobacteria bacterium]|nr:peptide chain release factor 2 [Alphaproteobacteria bacterium]
MSSLTNELKELEEKTSSPNLWDNPDFAQKLMSQKAEVERKINLYETKKKEYENLHELLDLAKLENDSDLVSDTEIQLENFVSSLEKEKLNLMLNGEADNLPAYLEIHSGAGGTEACDWAQMLLRMYIRWGERHGYKVDLIEEHAGDEAGIKSATLQITGINVYGWLKGESGIHRLVRISPFDSNARRHTSFASVWVYPVIDDKIEIHIEEKDLRIDTYRASGAGGQHVNKTDSAVRITHIPTGIVVQCQNERSQFKNKDVAMSMLKSRLYNLELEKRAEEEAKINESKSEIGWGAQIRSYVLQPYQMIKDLRTNFETSNITSTLDGDIDEFLSATLLYNNIKK